MTRRLPWARDSEKAAKREIKSPASPAPTRTPARQTPQASRALSSRPSERKPTASAKSLSYRPDRSPSTSPPPQPIPETFLIPGLENDDLYRMVEDEFLVTAGKFTAHLHAAEYQRLKTQARSQNADTIANISRPVVGSLTELARKRQEELQRRRTQRQGLRNAKADAGTEDGETEEEVEALLRGSSLQGLMDSPRKREVKISALVRGDSITKATRSTLERPGSSRAGEEVQRKLAFSSGKTAKRPLPEETEGEDEDGLDVPVRGRFTPSRRTVAKPASEMAASVHEGRSAASRQSTTVSPPATRIPATGSSLAAKTRTAPRINPMKEHQELDTESDEDDIFARLKSRQTSDRQRRPAARKETKGRDHAEGDVIPSFM